MVPPELLLMVPPELLLKMPELLMVPLGLLKPKGELMVMVPPELLVMRPELRKPRELMVPELLMVPPLLTVMVPMFCNVIPGDIVSVSPELIVKDVTVQVFVPLQVPPMASQEA